MRNYGLLLLSLLLAATAAGAGHDISTIRYVPPVTRGDATMFYDGTSFVAATTLNDGISVTRTDPSTGTTSLPTPMLSFADPRKPYGTRRWLSNGFAAAEPTSASDDRLELTNLRTNVVRSVSHHAVVPRIAANGDRILIVDRSEMITATSGSMSASLFRGDGSTVALTAVPVFPSDAYDVASSGDGFAIATAGASGVHLFRVNAAGEIVSDRLLQAAGAIPLFARPSVSVAVGADRTVVAWTALGRAFGYVASVSAAGEVTGPQPLPSTAAYLDDNVQVLATAAGYVVVWNLFPVTPGNAGGVAGVRLDAAGHLLDSTPTLLSVWPFLAAAASPDTIAIETMAPPFEAAVTTVAVRAGGLEVRPASGILAPATQRNVKLASDGVDFVGVWQQSEGGTAVLMVGRVSRSGVPLDGAGVTLPNAPVTDDIHIIRGGGGDALIVVAGINGVDVFRWSRSAGLLDTHPIVLTSNVANGAAAVWDGTRYLVVWSEFQVIGGGVTTQMVRRFVGSDGSLFPPLTVPAFAAVKPGDKYPKNPAVAWDGRQFLIASPMVPTDQPCTFDPCPPPPPNEVRMVRLAADGVAVDEHATSIPGVHGSARVASSGSEFLVALDDRTFRIVKSTPAGLDVGAARPFFTPVDTFPTEADVAWDGSGYLIAWIFDVRLGGPAWLETARVDRSGAIAASAYAGPIVQPRFPPSVAANDAGEAAIALDEVTAETQTSRARIYFPRELSAVPPPPAAPRYLISHLHGTSALLTWESDAADAFVVESAYGTFWSMVAAIDGSARSTTVTFVRAGDRFRIRSAGPGGVSADGPFTSIGSERRARAIRP